jgi:peptide/nickel transport system substrate-binding protein
MLAVPSALAACSGGDSGGTATGAETGAEAAPKKGGSFRVAVAGGGAAGTESLNPNQPLAEIDFARYKALFEQLTTQGPDGSLVNQLADEYSPNADGTVWKIKLRPGTTWHDGSPFTPDDIIYSFRYMLDPKTASEGASDLTGLIDPNGMRALDATTLELSLLQPSAILDTTLSSRSIWIFKDGTTSFDKPVGTGPWKFVEWTPGERSLFVRNDEYPVHGGPYLEELELITINDQQARVNALVAGEIDALAELAPALVGTIEANSDLRLLEYSEAGGRVSCQAMNVQAEPFTDPKVRQAFRLMVDRQQIIDTALLGYGALGNDLHGRGGPEYAADIPQREYDPEQAQALLKSAGKEGLTVQMLTSDVSPAQLESSTLMAEQAKKIGVTITLEKIPADQFYSGGRWLKEAFTTGLWAFRSLDAYMAASYSSKAPLNETHWQRPDFDKLWSETRATLDPAARTEKWYELQEILWNEGGYIIWGYNSVLDAYSSKVNGLYGGGVRPLGYYDFLNVSLT